MRQIAEVEVGAVSGGVIGAPPGPLIEVGQTGMGSDNDYGGFSYKWDDGSYVSFDGNGNVIGGYDTDGHWFDSDSVADYGRQTRGIMTQQEAEDFANLIDWVINGWRGR